MSRIRTVLVAAAALVVGSAVALGIALTQGAQTVAPPMNCNEWATAVAKYADPQHRETVYLAVPIGTAVPAAYGDRILGDCAAGVCTIKPSACDVSAYWSYKTGAALGGKVIVRVVAPLYIAEGARQWVGSVVGGLWLGSFGQAVTTCLGITTRANCITMFAGVVDCWLQGNGTLCRYGLLYGPGEGGKNACTPDAGALPMPCEVSRGAGSELVDVARAFTPEDLAAAQ